MKIKKAFFSCVYSFLPVAGEMTYDIDVLSTFIETGKGQWGKPNCADKDIYNSRQGLSNYLALDFIESMGFEILEPLPAIIEELNLNITIHPLFRYYSFGASLSFLIEVENVKNNCTYLEISNLYNLLQIISVEKNNKSNIKISLKGNIQRTLFEIFENFVFEKINEVNNYIYRRFLSTELKLTFDTTSETISFSSCLDNLSFNNIQKYTDILFAYLQANYPDNQSILSYDRATDFVSKQHVNLFCKRYLLDNMSKESNVPWLSVAFEIDNTGNAYKAFCGSFSELSRINAIKNKMEAISTYEKQIAPFIYRAIDNKFNDYQIEPCYDNYSDIKRYHGFENMYVDARLYMHLSRRSILLLTDSFESNPGNYVLPTLFDICEINHTRWQSLLILNRMLDEKIKSFSNHKYDLLSSKEKLSIIIQILKKSSICLDDPTSYVISGDSLREVHDMLISTFKIKDLQLLAIQKSEMLERIYSLGNKLDL